MGPVVVEDVQGATAGEGVESRGTIRKRTNTRPAARLAAGKPTAPKAITLNSNAEARWDMHPCAAPIRSGLKLPPFLCTKTATAAATTATLQLAAKTSKL